MVEKLRINEDKTSALSKHQLLSDYFRQSLDYFYYSGKKAGLRFIDIPKFVFFKYEGKLTYTPRFCFKAIELGLKKVTIQTLLK